VLNPNKLLQQTVAMNREVQRALAPVVKRAEDAIQRAEASQYVQGMPLMRNLAKTAGTAIVENCEVLTDMVLDDILEETAALLERLEDEERVDSGLEAATSQLDDFEAMRASIERRVHGGYRPEVLTSPGTEPAGTSQGLAAPMRVQPPAVAGHGTQRQQAVPLPIDVVRRIEGYRNRYQDYSASVDAALELQGVERHEIVASVAEDFIEDLIQGATDELAGMVDAFSDSLVNGELMLKA